MDSMRWPHDKYDENAGHAPKQLYWRPNVNENRDNAGRSGGWNGDNAGRSGGWSGGNNNWGNPVGRTARSNSVSSVSENKGQIVNKHGQGDNPSGWANNSIRSRNSSSGSDAQRFSRETVNHYEPEVNRANAQNLERRRPFVPKYECPQRRNEHFMKQDRPVVNVKEQGYSSSSMSQDNQNSSINSRATYSSGVRSPNEKGIQGSFQDSYERKNDLPPHFQRTNEVESCVAIQPINVYKEFILPNVAKDQLKEVTLSFIDSPAHFYCQCVDLEPTFKDLEAKLQMEYKNPRSYIQVSEPILGMPCCARYVEDNMWYRGKVISIQNNRIKVFYVDYGNEDFVSMSDIAILKEDFFSFPIHAIKCMLENYDGLSNEEVQRFLSFDELDLMCWFKETNENNFHKVSIFEKSKFKSLLVNTLSKSAESAIEVQDINIKISGQTKIVQNYVTEPAVEPVYIEVKSRLPENYLAIGTSERVFISHVVGPSEFYCQLQSSEHDIYSLIDLLQEHYAVDCNQLSSYGINTDCVARFPDDESWYRARIEEVNDSDVKVLFVDYGNTSVVCFDDLRKLDDKFFEFNIQAFRCRLPTSGCRIRLSEKHIDTQGLCTFLGREHGSYNVEVVLDNDIAEKIENESVTDLEEQYQNIKLNERKEVTESDNVDSHCTLERIKESQGISNSDDLLIKDYPCFFIPCSRLEAFISHVESPLRFFIQESSVSDQLDQITDSLSAVPFGETPDISLNVGQACIALFSADESWYRAKILELNHEMCSATVLFVDFGNSEVVTLENLRLVPKELSDIPALAIECQLNGVVEQDLWTQEAINEFINIVTIGEKAMLVHFKDMEYIPYRVRLLDCGLDVAKKMSDLGYLEVIEEPESNNAFDSSICTESIEMEINRNFNSPEIKSTPNLNKNVICDIASSFSTDTSVSEDKPESPFIVVEANCDFKNSVKFSASNVIEAEELAEDISELNLEVQDVLSYEKSVQSVDEVQVNCTKINIENAEVEFVNTECNTEAATQVECLEKDYELITDEMDSLHSKELEVNVASISLPNNDLQSDSSVPEIIQDEMENENIEFKLEGEENVQATDAIHFHTESNNLGYILDTEANDEYADGEITVIENKTSNDQSELGSKMELEKVGEFNLKDEIDLNLELEITTDLNLSSEESKESNIPEEFKEGNYELNLGDDKAEDMKMMVVSSDLILEPSIPEGFQEDSSDIFTLDSKSMNLQDETKPDLIEIQDEKRVYVGTYRDLSEIYSCEQTRANATLNLNLESEEFQEGVCKNCALSDHQSLDSENDASSGFLEDSLKVEPEYSDGDSVNKYKNLEVEFKKLTITESSVQLHIQDLNDVSGKMDSTVDALSKVEPVAASLVENNDEIQNQNEVTFGNISKIDENKTIFEIPKIEITIEDDCELPNLSTDLGDVYEDKSTFEVTFKVDEGSSHEDNEIKEICCDKEEITKN